MGRFLLWISLGYAACVWDSSCSPFDSRWPSAGGILIVMLAMREPQLSVWGAALCGLTLDAMQGGQLGPRAIAGVAAAGLVSRVATGSSPRSWLRVVLSTVGAIIVWLAVPQIPGWVSHARVSVPESTVRMLAMTTISTCLVALAIHRVAIRRDHAD